MDEKMGEIIPFRQRKAAIEPKRTYEMVQPSQEELIAAGRVINAALAAKQDLPDDGSNVSNALLNYRVAEANHTFLRYQSGL